MLRPRRYLGRTMTDAEPYTKIPNALLDTMHELGNAELRIVLAIVRRTAGWQKECDVISLTQLETMTGLGRRHVIQGLRELETRGLIEHTPAKRNGRCYRLVTPGNQSPKGTSNLREPELVTLGNQSAPQLVTLGNTQKKDPKERIKKERETRTQASLDFLHEGVVIYKRLSGKKPVPAMVKRIADTVTDYPFWETVVTNWCGKFRADNIDGMIDWYLHPEKMARSLNANGHKPAENRPPLPSFKPAADKPDQQASIKALGEAARQRLKWKDE